MPENSFERFEGSRTQEQSYLNPLTNTTMEDARQAWATPRQTNALDQFPSADSLLSNIQDVNTTPTMEYALANQSDLLRVDDLRRVGVNRSQAGSAEDFRRVMDGTRFGPTRGADADRALISLGARTPILSDGRLSPPRPVNNPFVSSDSRYVNTREADWMDMTHFMFYAGRARGYQSQGLSVAESGLRAMADGIGQEFLDRPQSSFSSEDLPSDARGIDFALNHFNPRSNLTLSQQVQNYLVNVLGARRREQAPNWNRLPETDQGRTIS